MLLDRPRPLGQRRGLHDLTPPPPDEGVQANARISSLIGFTLLIMIAAQGVTILDMGALLPWHKAIGIALIPPVAVKLASIGWRVSRYYLGDARYRQAGPPHPFLRALGPLVVFATALLLATGLGGVLLKDDTLLSIHTKTFWFWIGLLGLHLLAHLWGTLRLVVRDLRRVSGDVFHRRVRWGIVGATLTSGVVVGLTAHSVMN